MRRLVALTCRCWRPHGTAVDRSTPLLMARQPRFVAVRLSDASSPSRPARVASPQPHSGHAKGHAPLDANYRRFPPLLVSRCGPLTGQRDNMQPMLRKSRVQVAS